jgi:TldD protein
LYDSLSKALEGRPAGGGDYIELRSQDVLYTSIGVRNSEVESLSERSIRGCSARVLADGVWGFSFSDGSRDVASAIAQAAGAARSTSLKWDDSGVSLAAVKAVNKRISLSVETPMAEVDVSEKIAFLADVCSSVKSGDSRIKSCWADYNEVAGERLLMTSEGTVVESEVSEMNLIVTASARDAGTQASARDEIGVVMTGWEFLEDAEPSSHIHERLLVKIKGQLNGVSCLRGSHPCVLGPRVVGMLAHEALGLLSEADLFCTGAFKDMEGKKIAPDSVTMLDSPSMSGGFGNIEVDDEGVAPRDVVLIDEGHLGEQMLNREWAARLGREPTGNARAESYRKPPIIRMRNTYFAPGDRTVDELVESIREGYYCGDVRGGQAESNSSFQIGIQDCYEIRNGEIGRPVKDLAISGIAIRSLSLIDGVGKDFGYESSYCGKFDQSMATSDGGPHMSLKNGAIVFGGA